MNEDRSVDAAGAGLAPGDLLDGKYRLQKVLGEGGMGIVFLAEHERLRERVAIKLLHKEAAEHKEILGRFEREARIAAKIKSEHVARTVDIGELESGAPFIVMEFMEGEDLAERLDQGPLDISLGVDLLLQAMEALAEAHSLGVVHRDLKPANLFLAKRRNGEEILKVLDFGISKLQQADEMDLTRTSTMMGSPMYMSPEQMANSKGVDHRTDIWSLGVILYRALTGIAPFNAETLTELVLVVTQTEPKAPTQHREDLPAGLEKVILQCLAKTPDERPGDLGELASLLEPFASDSGRHSVEDIRKTSSFQNGIEPIRTVAQQETKAPCGGAREQQGQTLSAAERTLPPPPFDSNPARKWVVAGLVTALVGGTVLMATTGAEPRRKETGSTAPNAPLKEDLARAQPESESKPPLMDREPEPETQPPSEDETGAEVPPLLGRAVAAPRPKPAPPRPTPPRPRPDPEPKAAPTNPYATP